MPVTRAVLLRDATGANSPLRTLDTRSSGGRLGSAYSDLHARKPGEEGSCRLRDLLLLDRQSFLPAKQMTKLPQYLSREGARRLAPR